MSRAERQYLQHVAATQGRLLDYQKRERKALVALLIAGVLLLLCCLAGGADRPPFSRPAPAPVIDLAVPGF